MEAVLLQALQIQVGIQSTGQKSYCVSLLWDHHSAIVLLQTSHVPHCRPTQDSTYLTSREDTGFIIEKVHELQTQQSIRIHKHQTRLSLVDKQ